MNHFYYESRAKEKLGELRKQGMLSQAVNREAPARPSFLNVIRNWLSGALRRPRKESISALPRADESVP
jgi:hypothetical protein